MFIYFWDRERETECERGRGREKGRHRIWSRLQARSCQHRAWRGAWTHELWDQKPELKSDSQPTEPPRCPRHNFLFKKSSNFKVFLKNVYLFLKEREKQGAREGQRERETQNLKQAPGSELSAQSPTRTWTCKLQDNDPSQSWMLK